jgi:hypothetical protein
MPKWVGDIGGIDPWGILKSPPILFPQNGATQCEGPRRHETALGLKPLNYFEA